MGKKLSNIKEKFVSACKGVIHSISSTIKSYDSMIDLFERNFRMVLLLFILILLYTENRYSYERKRAELDRTIEERTRIESEMITLRNQFNVTSSRSAVLKKLRQQGSPVGETGDPMIIIDNVK